MGINNGRGCLQGLVIRLQRELTILCFTKLLKPLKMLIQINIQSTETDPQTLINLAIAALQKQSRETLTSGQTKWSINDNTKIEIRRDSFIHRPVKL